LGGGDDAELWGVGPADRDETGGPDAGGEVGVAVLPPVPVPQEPHALVERLTGLVAGDVLDQERDTGERCSAPTPSAGPHPGGLVAGPLEAGVDHRVQLR